MLYGYMAHNASHNVLQADSMGDRVWDSVPTVSGLFGWVEAAPSLPELRDSAENQEANLEIVTREELVDFLGFDLVTKLDAKSQEYYECRCAIEELSDETLPEHIEVQACGETPHNGMSLNLHRIENGLAAYVGTAQGDDKEIPAFVVSPVFNPLTAADHETAVHVHAADPTEREKLGLDPLPPRESLYSRIGMSPSLSTLDIGYGCMGDNVIEGVAEAAYTQAAAKIATAKTQELIDAGIAQMPDAIPLDGSGTDGVPAIIEAVTNQNLPDRILMPPCGDMFPNGRVLSLHRLPSGEVCYITDSENAEEPTQAFTLEPIIHKGPDDESSYMNSESVRIGAAYSHQWAQFGLEGHQSMWDSLRPLGLSPYMTINDDHPEGMMQAIADGIAELAYVQASAHAIAVEDRQRSVNLDQKKEGIGR